MNNIVSKPKETAAQIIQGDMFKQSLKMALPRHMNPERMARIAMTELRKTPKLAQCDPYSFVGSIIQCGQLGLEPGNNLGHAYLLPYGKDCNLIIGYRGMIDLARRSGQVISIQAHTVYEEDFFEFEYGLTPKLRHIPYRKTGIPTHAYACAMLKDGGNQFEVMSLEEIKQIQKSSKAGNSGPWQTHFDEMARKTVIRRLFKYLPVSVEMTQAIIIDEQADIGKQDNASILEHMHDDMNERSEDNTSKSNHILEKMSLDDSDDRMNEEDRNQNKPVKNYESE